MADSFKFHSLLKILDFFYFIFSPWHRAISTKSFNRIITYKWSSIIFIRRSMGNRLSNKNVHFSFRGLVGL